MLLKEIYDRDITRHINPAVVVRDNDPETINAEIDEYVFTKELLEKLYIFLDTFLNKKSGKTGIWINGYYGSGKSHFIKYIHYCLDPLTRDRAFQHLQKKLRTSALDLSDVTESNVVLLKKKLDQDGCENIIFNVEDVTGDGSAGARLTRVFLNMLNRHRGYNATNIILAVHFEKHLDRKGIFEEFKKILLEDEGFKWEADCNRLASSQLQMIVDLAGSLDKSLDTKSMYNTLNNPDAIEITIDGTLIPEVNEYLALLPGNHRLIFLVDEVSQYIGKNKEILLNFQTIVESLSVNCKGRAWVACTAQQSLSELTENISELDVKDEFGKILGRFDTRISLESNDAAFITQKRVLEKNSEGTKALQALYKKNTDAIEMQFKMNHDLFHGFASEDDFFLAYPFIPYQFKLISHVFDSFQNLNYVIREVKDNERSVLGITHFTAKENANSEVGHFIPFDAFFNNQFSSNMQFRGRKAINPAMELSFVKNDSFSQRVVKVLFMISNLSDPIRQTFPSNIENLALLMMNSLDQNKLGLQQKIKVVLDHLVEESVIREEKGGYFFFKEDEIEVTNEINNTSVNLDDRLQEFFEIISPLLKVNQKAKLNNVDFSVGFSVDDKLFLNGNHANVTLVLYETRHADEIRLSNPDNRLLICLNEWFSKEDTLGKDLMRYFKTIKYLKNRSDSSSGQRAETLNNFRQRNNRLLTKIQNKIKEKLPETRFVSGQTLFDSSAITGSTPEERHRNAVEKHLTRIFRHIKLADSYSKTNQELFEKLKDGIQQTIDNTLSQAEEMVEMEILNLGQEANIQDLVKKFSVAPFGWKDVAVIDIVVQLNLKRKRSLEYKNNVVTLQEFASKAVSNAERASCVVKSLSGPGQSEINKAIKDFKSIFNENIKEDTDYDKVIKTMKEKMSGYRKSYAEFEKDYYGKYAPGIHFYNLNEKLLELIEIRNPESFFKGLTASVTDLTDIYESAKTLKGWLEKSADEYKSALETIKTENSNFGLFKKDYADKFATLEAFPTDLKPWDNIRPVRKAIEEFKILLGNKTKALKESAIIKYSEIYEELDKKCKEEKVEDSLNLYATKQDTLNKIEALSSLTELENIILKAQNFYDEAWNKITDTSSLKKPEDGKTVKQRVAFKPRKGRKTELKSEDDVNAFISNEKEELLKLIKENKIVIIN